MPFINKDRSPVDAYNHNHPPVRNINDEFIEHQSVGQKIADRVASIIGSWPFIIIQSCFLAAWLAVNSYLLYMFHTRQGFLKAWDPYPFILLNLLLSFQAAYTGPVVMMSQNRQADKDRMAAEHDFEVNLKAEKEIQIVMEQLARQDKLLLEMMQKIDDLNRSVADNRLSGTVISYSAKDGGDGQAN